VLRHEQIRQVENRLHAIFLPHPSKWIFVTAIFAAGSAKESLGRPWAVSIKMWEIPPAWEISLVGEILTCCSPKWCAELGCFSVSRLRWDFYSSYAREERRRNVNKLHFVILNWNKILFTICSSIELEPQLLISRWHRHLLHLLNNNPKVSFKDK
jgi:hypothetical protein